MRKSYQKESLSDYMRGLSSADPVPGGGAAAAVCAAQGAALMGMVVSLTEKNKRYDNVRDEMKNLEKAASDLREKFLELADKDAEAFTALSESWRLPKGTIEEKARRNEVMEEALRAAASPPFQIMETIHLTIPMLQKAAEDGSRLAVSDAGCAAALFQGALKAASLNVTANTELMKDRVYAGSLDRRMRQILSEDLPKLEAVYASVR